MGFISGFPKKHVLQEQLERFTHIYDAYFAKIDAEAGPRDTHLSMLARSAASPMCRVLTERIDEFAARGITVQAIFARLGPVEPLIGFMEAVQRLNGHGHVAAALRWAKNPCLLNAHEQLTLGLRMCWTGDCMRRSADARNALDLFEENSLSSVRLGELAFAAMWTASKPLPKELFDQAGEQGDTMEDADAGSIAETLIKPQAGAVIIKLRAKA